MSNYAISLKRSSLLLAALAFTAVLTIVNFAAFFSSASAAQLGSRSLALSSSLAGTETGGLAGSETNGSDAIHTFEFTTGPAGSTAVAARLLYCTTAIGTCTTPTGLVTTGATLSDSTNAGLLVVDSVAVNGTIDLDTGTFQNSTVTTIEISDVVNPTTLGSFFVRIELDSDTPGGTMVDEGTVASSITEGIAITSRVAETLGFSTTAEFDDATDVPDPAGSCAPLTGSGAIALGDPDEGALSLSTTYEAYSAFRIYTNSALGSSVTYEGATLTKDVSNNIDAIGGTAAAVNVAGSDEQFGLAVDGAIGGTASHLPNSRSLGEEQDFTYVDNTADFDGAAGNIAIGAQYGDGGGDITTADPTFAFVADTNTEIASSTSYVNCATAAVRYVANIEPLTAAGTYTTTIVYSAVPQY